MSCTCCGTICSLMEKTFWILPEAECRAEMTAIMHCLRQRIASSIKTISQDRYVVLCLHEAEVRGTKTTILHGYWLLSFLASLASVPVPDRPAKLLTRMEAPPCKHVMANQQERRPNHVNQTCTEKQGRDILDFRGDSFCGERRGGR